MSSVIAELFQFQTSLHFILNEMYVNRCETGCKQKYT